MAPRTRTLARSRLLLAVLVVPLLASANAPAADTEAKTAPAVAPADYDLFESDRAGAFFVPKTLKTRYDALLERLAALRERIDQAKIGGADARKEVEALQAELAALRTDIDKVKLYIPGAAVHTESISDDIPFDPAQFLLVECGSVEIRGGEGLNIHATLEKTVLSEPGGDPKPDFTGIKLAHRVVLGAKHFGYYATMRNREDGKKDWERFPFKDFVDRAFLHLTIEGLNHEQGNRWINLEMKNADGAGQQRGDWRRHAKLVVEVPRCNKVGVVGVLGGFKVVGLQAALVVQGGGDRDYDATYEIENLDGTLDAANVPFDRVTGATGDVSIDATAYAGTGSTTHDDHGVTVRPAVSREWAYDGIAGSLKVRTTRAGLQIGRVGGRIDVENDFGRTELTSDAPLPAKDHRIVSQSGTIEIRLSEQAVAKSGLALFTECGTIRLAPETDRGLDEKMYTTSGDSFGGGDGVRRSWHGFTNVAGDGRGSFDVLARVGAALHGEPRTPGLDIINRGGTIVLARPKAATP